MDFGFETFATFVGFDFAEGAFLGRFVGFATVLDVLDRIFPKRKSSRSSLIQQGLFKRVIFVYSMVTRAVSLIKCANTPPR